MKRLTLIPILAALVAFLLPGSVRAQEYAAFACPPELASLTFPEPRICIESQGWWIQGSTSLSAPAASFPLDSTHVHLMVPFPLGERMVLPPSGQGMSWPYLTQFHNGVGGTVKVVRGGGFNGLLSYIPTDPNYKSVPISVNDQRHAGAIPITASDVDKFRAYTGKRENRFTTDTTSKFGQRQYMSDSWNAFLNAPGAATSLRSRGWYATSDYTDVVLQTGVRASMLASSGLPSTLSYSLGSGASFAFAYIDANIHGGSKGTVLFENRTGSSGSFALPALAPGNHVLLLGGWEKASNGWNAGVIRLPFHVN